MNKTEFLHELKDKLSGLPQDDVDERLSFYEEMIDDRMEEGASEEEAVAGIGSVDDVVSQIVADIPLAKIVKEKVKPKRTLKAWEIVLIALGFPLWFPLLAAAGAVILSLYVTVWALIVSLWAVELALCVCSVGFIVGSVIYFALGYGIQGTALLGIGLFCAGLSVFTFFGCLYATKGILKLTKKAVTGIKKRFVRKDKEK